VSRTFFNEKATIWDKAVAEKDTAKLESMKKRLEIKPGAMLLDVGTGTGTFIPYLLKSIGKNGRLFALDCAEEMLKISRGKGFCGRIDYLHADVASIPLAGDTCDAVVCYSSFPHFQDKPRAISEIYRVLKPGGRLFICHTSSRTTINDIHRQIPAVQHDTIPDDNKMEKLLIGAGFTGIAISNRPDSYLAGASKPLANSL
jgi:ubiquinone/menaquinone biosynthesis C-methylase UbiE